MERSKKNACIAGVSNHTNVKIQPVFAPYTMLLVLDTLCGCVRQADGTVKLLNFKLSSDEVMVYG